MLLSVVQWLEHSAWSHRLFLVAAEAQRGFGYSQTLSRRSFIVCTSSKPYVGSLVANDLTFAIVIARFNDLVTKLLLEGALEAFDRHGGSRDEVDVSTNPEHASPHFFAQALLMPDMHLQTTI